MLGELIQRWDPKIVFLSETKIKKKVMEKVMEKSNLLMGSLHLEMVREDDQLRCGEEKLTWKLWDTPKALLMQLS